MAVSLVDDWNTLDMLLASSPVNIEAVCAMIARIMGVGKQEVGLLKVYGLSLEFIFPFALKSAGRIPVSTSAVAARTAESKKTELFNNFTTVSHNTVFELVPLDPEPKASSNPTHIQKLMSAPVLDGNRKSIGVIEISRKGWTRDESGPDFTGEDMQNLIRVADKLGPIFEKL